MCGMTCIAIKSGHMCIFSQFFICCHGRCIAGIYIFHYNPNLTSSISLHEQVMSPNDGPFSSFWYLPSYLYRSYYPITHCLCGYKPILILKPWTLRLSLENTWDTKMNIPLCMLLKNQILWFPSWGWSMHSPIKFAVLYHHNGA